MSQPPGARTVLGFDYGRRRIGVAVGQELTASARPLAVLNNRGDPPQPDWPSIGRLIAEWRPALLVVGLPLHADGSANPITHAARDFAAELERRFALFVATVDERLSSFEAGTRQLGSRRPTPRGKKKTAPVDDTAAAVILETWLRLPLEQRQPPPPTSS